MIRPEDIELNIATEKLCFVAIKARQYMAKEDNVMPDEGSNPADDRMIEVLEIGPDDPVRQELASFINAMDEDEQIDLVALAWLGRGDYTLDEWQDARAEARDARSSGPTSRYLLGLPLLADFLEDALSMLERSCEDVEAEHL